MVRPTVAAYPAGRRVKSRDAGGPRNHPDHSATDRHCVVDDLELRLGTEDIPLDVIGDCRGDFSYSAAFHRYELDAQASGLTEEPLAFVKPLACASSL